MQDVTLGCCRIKEFNNPLVIIKLGLRSSTQSSLSNFKSITCSLNVAHGICADRAACCSHSPRDFAAQILSKATNRYINLGAWQEIPFRWQQNVHAVRSAAVYCDEINWSQQMKARGPKQQREKTIKVSCRLPGLRCHPLDKDRTAPLWTFYELRTV